MSTNDAFDSGDGQSTDPQTPTHPTGQNAISSVLDEANFVAQAPAQPTPPSGLEPLYAGVDEEVSADEELAGDVNTAFEIMFTTLQEQVHENAVNHGFWDDVNQHSIGCMIALAHSELSEFLEADRSDNPTRRDGRVRSHENRTIELADTVIRCMDIAEQLGLPLAQGIIEKMRVNASRPHRHGKKY